MEQPFKVTIVEPPSTSDYVFNVAPDFLGELEDQYVTLGDSLIYELGDKTNFFGTEVTVTLDVRKITRFAHYDPDVNALVL